MKDPFALLGLPAKYDIDLGELQEKHKRLSLELHPDRLRGRLPRERREALFLAIEVNQAYRTLRDPVERARALAATLGLRLSDEDGPASDMSFLTEMMELQETLSECEARGDAGGVARVIENSRAESEKIQGSLARLFEAPEPASEQAAELIGRLRYHARFLDQAELASDNLSGGADAARHL